MLNAILALSPIEQQQKCWSIYDAAVRERAVTADPAYVQYDMHRTLIEDGIVLDRTFDHITYRARDGMARVADDRFIGEDGYVTNRLEPGPPQLGPYGTSRNSWLTRPDGALKTIGQVRAHAARACMVQDVERYRGHETYHLVITPFDNSKPALKALWIDTSSEQIWKVVVSGYLFFINAAPGQRPLVDFAVELAPESGYIMVDHVTWEYRLREYGQESVFFGEYSMNAYSYPAAIDSGRFAVRAP